MEHGDRTFRSKIDTWLALLVAGGVGATWLATLRPIWAGRPIDALDFIVPLLATAFVVWVFRATYYVITDDELIVRAGPFQRTVRLESIRRFRATHNPLSSPALSLDRMEVTYGSKRMLVSPQDKREFVKAVKRRVPTAVIEGLSAM